MSDAPLPKITLSSEDLWIIRSTLTWPTSYVGEPDHREVQYYEAPSCWNSSPLKATIFRAYDVALGHIKMYNQRDRPSKGWADGRIEKLEAVLLYTELLMSPNGTTVHIK